MVAYVRPLQVALVLALAIVATSQEVNDAPAEQEVNDRAERALKPDELKGKSEGRILGNVRTTTLWAISVSTSTGFLSCLSGITTTTACNGKRKKRQTNIAYIPDNYDPEISGSLANDAIQEKEQELEADRSGKIYGFTVWTAVTQSTTVTVFSTNSASTVRLSFYCSAALATVPQLSCG